ncbi:YggT family protein [Sinanaerobacter chloroacetimidivorans]|jgi:YggT family protein|uniref:YggT family protein n=1 Tax=Sinanaerobacter chloroacetimidivorans TaxID=2818044 RepID=A0A8J7W077_9FIRM|nr:YggT family protein [Sinanaerobacter chloroacetimidivorans]MBR0596791.1 YggT family protein [Sinanaerobacter chloroacetimidivorans]
MIYVLINAINTFFQILVYLILARAVLSWFIRAPYGSVYKIYVMIMQITEPMLAPCRNILARFGLAGTIDFSPILAIIGLSVINSILVNIIRIFIF